MDIGNALLIFFLIILVFSFVGLLINMIDSCCNELLADESEATVSSITATLNDTMYRRESRYRFRYDTSYETYDRCASFREARHFDFELPIRSYRYGYPLPTAAEQPPEVSPFSRASSYRSGHSTSYTERQLSVRLPPSPREEVEREISPSTTIQSSIEISEDPPPSYDEVVGKAFSIL